mgnify:CR=1 FL=1
MQTMIQQVYRTRATLPILLENYTAEQKAATEIKTADNVSIFDFEMFQGIIEDKYPFYVTDLYSASESITEAQAATMFYNKYARWKSRRLDGIRKAYRALTEDYNPIWNYDRYEEGTETDTTTHGLKVSTNVDTKTSNNTDLKSATASDVKVSNNTDIKTAHAENYKDSTNTDIKASTATDVKASTASDLTSAINTNMQESETLSTQTDKRPTWSADNQTTAVQTMLPGTKTKSGDDEDNFTHTTGSATNNYTQTEGNVENNYTRTAGTAENNYTQRIATGTDNYDQTTGTALDNYSKTEGSAQNNYTQTTGNALNNYSQTTANGLNNYTQESGTTKREHEKDNVHMYGNIGVTQSSELVQNELLLRKYDLVDSLVREFVESVSYYVSDLIEEGV